MKKVKELISLMKRQKVRRLKLSEKGLDIDIELEPNHPIDFHPSHHIPSHAHGHPPMPGVPVEKPQKESDSGTFIRSPLVGTFYAAASPSEAPFVKPGDRVTPETVVCIVEAMKVMNEVKAGVSGKVKAVLVSDGNPVEFDTKLIQVE